MLYGVAGAAFAFGIFIRVASVVYVARTAPFSARCGFLQIFAAREREVATPHLPLLILYGYLCCTFHLSLCCFSGTNEAIQKAAPCPGRGGKLSCVCHVAIHSFSSTVPHPPQPVVFLFAFYNKRHNNYHLNYIGLSLFSPLPRKNFSTN